MRIGIDLGGTKIEGIALADNGDTLFRERLPTPQEDYAGTLDAIAKLIDQIEKHCKNQGSIGIGIPGSLSPTTGVMRNANSTCLNSQPLQQDLEQRLKRPVRLANDADCFALSEAIDGAGQGAASVFGVIIGTGTGGGVVINSKLLSGPNRIAGEWGHNPLPWANASELPGPDCYCGKQGCIETFLSGPGFSHAYEKATGEKLTAQQIMLRVSCGEGLAQQCLAEYENRMARALASVINIIDPEVIVLGGGMSKIPTLYENVPSLWKDYVFSDGVSTKLKPPEHGDSSGVRGAAWLWPANTA